MKYRFIFVMLLSCLFFDAAAQKISVKEYKSETAAAIVTIINAITAKGQRKKLLADEGVNALLVKYDIDIS